MTTKQIAEYVGKPEKTVRTWATKAGAKVAAMTAKMAVSHSSRPADWDLEETIAIIGTGMGANAAAMYRANAEKSTALPLTNALGDQAVGSTLTERDLQIISTIVALTIQKLDVRMSNIESRVEERQALLPAPSLSDRDALRQIVAKEAARSGREERWVWNELYEVAYYHHLGNLKLRAKNSKAKSVLDYADSEGLCGQLLAIAIDKWH